MMHGENNLKANYSVSVASRIVLISVYNRFTGSAGEAQRLSAETVLSVYLG